MQTSKRKIGIGTKVKVKQHWLRPLEEGVIVEHRPRARNSWLVRFEHSYPGGGIDGDKLYFEESDFLELEQPDAEVHPDGPRVREPGMRSEDFATVPNGHDIH
jgi:hypothetical protein